MPCSASINESTHLSYLSHDFSKYILTALLAFSIKTLVASFSMMLSASSVNFIFLENGLIETTTVIFYSLCIILFVWFHKVKSFTKYWSIVVLLMALALRELDFDKKFTTEGILKSEFLFSADVPMIEKILGGLVLIILIVALIHLIKTQAKPYWHAVWSFKSYAWALGFGFGLMVLAKSVDGIGRKLDTFQLSLTDYSDQLIQRCEEIYELGIPLAFMLSIYLYQRSNSI